MTILKQFPDFGQLSVVISPLQTCITAKLLAHHLSKLKGCSYTYQGLQCSSNSCRTLSTTYIMMWLKNYLHMHVMAICDWVWQKVLSPMTLFFVTNTKIHQYTIKFHCQNELVCFCWLTSWWSVWRVLVLDGALVSSSKRAVCKACKAPSCWMKTSAVF